MVKVRTAPLLGALVVAALAAGACSSSSKSSSSGPASATTTAAAATKTAFCKINADLDSKTTNASDAASVLAAIKANIGQIDAFGAAAPPEIKASADVLVSQSHAAITANSLDTIDKTAFAKAGDAVNAFCGQNPDGSPLTTVAGAATGNKTKFCADQVTMNAALAGANDGPSALAALKAHTSTIADFAATAPPEQQANAQVLVTTANAAIAANDGTKLNTPAVQAASSAIDTYCGIGGTTATTATPPTTA